MIYDEITLFAISSIYDTALEKKEIKTTEIAEKYYESEIAKQKFKNGNEKSVYKRSKTNFIARRLKLMEKEGLLTIRYECNGCSKVFPLDKFIKNLREDGKYFLVCPSCKKENKIQVMVKHYRLLGDKVLRCAHKFMGKKKESVLIQNKNGRWCGFEIE